jgi:cereblon
MFTSRKVQNVSYRGKAETQYSWFEGYSWTIMNCEDCGEHMGWKFKSSKLEPAKFFGISRNAIHPIRQNTAI